MNLSPKHELNAKSLHITDFYWVEGKIKNSFRFISVHLKNTENRGRKTKRK